jgi:hypothetical protein
MSGKMNWRRVHFETRGRDHGYTSIADERRFDAEWERRKKIAPVRTDQTFWKAWRKDTAGMKARGIDGRWRAWRAWIEQPDECVEPVQHTPDAPQSDERPPWK